MHWLDCLLLWKKSKEFFLLVMVLTHYEIKIHLVKYSGIYVDIGISKSTDINQSFLWKKKKVITTTTVTALNLDVKMKLLNFFKC